LDTFQPDRTDADTGAVVQSETDDSFTFTLGFKNGGSATMTCSSAVIPARGARIAVMGSEGTLFAEQASPNPAEDGGILGSQGGPLEPIETPARLMPFSDGRDPRLMAFRLLVRDFNRGIEDGVSPTPNFVDAWRCQQILDAIRESSDTGRTITIE
jgi:predicted dehydrogenase